MKTKRFLWCLLVIVLGSGLGGVAQETKLIVDPALFQSLGFFTGAFTMIVYDYFTKEDK